MQTSHSSKRAYLTRSFLARQVEAPTTTTTSQLGRRTLEDSNIDNQQSQHISETDNNLASNSNLASFLSQDTNMNIELPLDTLDDILDPSLDYVPDWCISQRTIVSPEASDDLSSIFPFGFDGMNDYVPSSVLTPAASLRSESPIQEEKTSADCIIDNIFGDDRRSHSDLDDLDEILQDENLNVAHPDDTLSGITITFPSTDGSLADVLSSQGLLIDRSGPIITVDEHFLSQEICERSPLADNSDSTPIQIAEEEETEDAVRVPSKRGRKRKSLASYDSQEKKKKEQNAAAAKRYRESKKKENGKIFEKRDKLREEVEKVREKYDSKMKERNFLLKLMYETSQKDPRMAGKIKWPVWIERWYKIQCEDA